MEFETEIQEAIYSALIGDSTLAGYLGGGVSDRRVYLEWNEDDLPACTSTEPGWIGIESLPENAPLTEKQQVLQRVILHVHATPENRTLRKNVRARLKALFHAPGGESGIWKNPYTRYLYYLNREKNARLMLKRHLTPLNGP